MKDWYEQWFNTDYYHYLYSHRDEAEAEAFLLLLKNNWKFGPKALDVACGRGRHSVILHQLGYDVTGLDLSSKNIAFAKKEEKEKLVFVEGDMLKDIPVQSYDLIVNLFTSFGYLESKEHDRAALASMLGGLRKGGVLVLDFLNATKAKKDLELGQEKSLFTAGLRFSWIKTIKGDCICKEISVLDGDRLRIYKESVRLHGLQDFQQMATELNATILHTFGNYYLEPFDPDESDRLILFFSA